jgi:hypothetical protein
MGSLFGWFLALRGVVLPAAPQLIARGAAAALTMIPVVQVGFGVLVLVGLWLTFVGWIAKPPPLPERIGRGHRSRSYERGLQSL